jgi:hypothetical protein
MSRWKGGSGLGRVQKAVLEAMRQNGGVWPQQWKISYVHQNVLNSLVKRGIIKYDNGIYRMVVT